MKMVKKIQIGQLLLDQKLITQEQLDQAILEQQRTGNKLGQVFVDLSMIKEEQLFDLIAHQLQIPFVDLKTYPLEPETIQLLPEFYARRFRSIVLKKDELGLLVGMADPQDVIAIDEISAILKMPLHFALIREIDLLQMIDVFYRRTAEISNLAEELSAEIHENDYDIAKLSAGLSVQDAPVVKLLQSIFEDAVQVNASDVHIEPDESILRIRQRIDGVLHEQILKEKQVAAALTLRLKLMGGLNIAEKRLPQDGRFSIKVKGKNFDVRLSTLPTHFGESVVMRLLNQSGELLHLEQIGMPAKMLERVREIITMPNGILLLTGPTGSGKTTTLYGFLSEVNDAQTKIITVEDPIEYRMQRINQVQVQAKIDLTFANVLRSILRQDPDVIMIGELRDQETVEIALRAAMTGHFVFSTLHTNDAPSAALRLIDMGAESFIVATVLRAVIAQRLVRRICVNCKEDYKPTPIEVIWLKSVEGFSYSERTFKHGSGCAYCHHTGYKGQIGVYELLEMNGGLADALRQKSLDKFMHLVGEDLNYQPLLLSAMNFVNEGLTTIDEVMRILGQNVSDNIRTQTAVNVS